jgi:type IV pilus assembly protein PilV
MFDVSIAGRTCPARPTLHGISTQAPLPAQRGASLLEVLVAILLMSFGMLGVAGMQAYSLAAHRNAAYRGVAASLANELAEQIRLNRAALDADQYNVVLLPSTRVPDATPCTFPTCDASDKLAKADLNDFQRRVREELPSGGVMVSRPSGTTRNADLWLLWNEPRVLISKKADGTSTEANADNCPGSAKTLDPLPRCFYMKVQL